MIRCGFEGCDRMATGQIKLFGKDEYIPVCEDHRNRYSNPPDDIHVGKNEYAIIEVFSMGSGDQVDYERIEGEATIQVKRKNPQSETLNNPNNIYVSEEAESSTETETGKKEGVMSPICPSCKNIVLEPIKTNPAGALKCPKCGKSWMPKPVANPKHGLKDMIILTLGWLDYEHNLTEFDSLEEMESTGRISYYRLAQLIRYLGFETLEEFHSATEKASENDKTDYAKIFGGK